MGASEAGSDGRRKGTGLTRLLHRHAPLLRYDSAERWFATAVEAWSSGPAGGPVHDPVRPDRVYGHAARGSDGRWWLAYWFFYLRNDPRLLGPWLAAGAHEGDWEMIQLRLDPAGAAPDLALYAQHAHVRARAWPATERHGDHPVIYVGRGSHACYFTRGWHWTGVWLERADGRGPSPSTALVELRDGDPATAWAHWPGRWGDTQPRRGLARRLGLVAASPRGPGHQRQWRDPAVLLAEVRSD